MNNVSLIFKPDRKANEVFANTRTKRRLRADRLPNTKQAGRVGDQGFDVPKARRARNEFQLRKQ